MNRLIVYSALILILGGCAGNPGAQTLKKGIRAMEKGRYAESIILFQRGIANISSNDQRAIAFNCMGISYHKLKQAQKALRSFEEAAAANPRAMEPVYNMGIVLFEAGEEDKAIACFEKAAILSDRAMLPAQSRSRSVVSDSRALEFMAVIYSRRQQWDEARRVLNEALKNTRHSPEILTSLALVELKADNTAKAMELLQEALEKDAHYAPAIYNLAVINHQVLNKEDQALPLFAEYTALVPSGPQADEVRSIIRKIKTPPVAPPAPPAKEEGQTTPSDSAKPAKTETNAEAPGAIQPPVPVAKPAIYPSFEELMQVAKKLEDQGRREAAFNNYLRIARAAEKQESNTSVRNQAIRHASSLASGNPQASYDLGIYFLENNKKDEACFYFKSAAEKDPNTRPAAMALARLAVEKKDFDTAIVSLKKADQINPEDPEALWLLADLYDRTLLLADSAASAYTRFITRFPRDRRAGEARDRLKIIKPEPEPEKKTSTVKSVNSQSFWQRMFKTAPSVANADSSKQSNKTDHQ